MKFKFPAVKPIANFLFILTTMATFNNLHAQGASNTAIEKIEASPQQNVIGAKKINATTVEVLFSNNQKMLLDFFGDNIFRLFQDNSGEGMRAPKAKPEAQILVDNPRKEVSDLNVIDQQNELSISTGKITIVFNKQTSLFRIVNTQTKTVVVEETALPVFDEKEVTLTLKESADEYFYGGGVQNGRFSHKGTTISIENQNSWTDGGVASPNPFYWSTKGYAVMWYSFKKGSYDFGNKAPGTVKLSHSTDYLDAFFMINDTSIALLNDFYQLTGNPVLIPKFGFYEGHLNAYNRDYWVEDEKGTLFEDGKLYKESQKDNDGARETLNGELGNYQFSGRAVVDRYKAHDMPLGWILPNDGYGAGYGQTETLDGNIQNLKTFGDYARKNGVEIGLWTQSDLHPIDSISALLQRDIVKEVRQAGVRALKTDVAWVGPGYSFGLNGVADAATIMSEYGDQARPFIISLDGWAGTQRYATIWSGDQTGGVWEYIRFHIPTYIGSGLSGQPNISSDMDGIFGGNKPIINMRDFQWKTFTPMQLNMDGWGANPKYPHALGEPAASINRNYLKLKSELLPYAYSIAKEAVDGKPMIRPMFMVSKNPYTEGKATQYQFMYGPNFLVAPIYQTTAADDFGNDIRNGIYLPEGTWIDYFSGETYKGNRIINHFDSPIWKLPVFVKSGAIIPMVNPNNNVSEIDKNLRIYEVYPAGKSSFTAYDDDGVSEAYKLGAGAYTSITSEVDSKNKALITVHPTTGQFNDFITEKATEFVVNVTEQPKAVVAKIGKKKVKLSEANSLEDFQAGVNVYFYNQAPNLNKFSTKGSGLEKLQIIKNPQVLVRVAPTDITKNGVSLEIKGFQFSPRDNNSITSGALTAPENAQATGDNVDAYTLTPTWNKVINADFYEVQFNNMLYSTIKETALLFDDLQPETSYNFKVRAVNKSGHSDWTDFMATTKNNPYEFAIKGITAKVSVPDQGGAQVANLFDFNESTGWHTSWDLKAETFDMIIDLNTINQLDKLEYMPRTGGGNGNILEGTLSYSNDKQEWTDVETFTWAKNDSIKTVIFDTNPTVRYVKLAITKAVGNFGSGSELYIYKVEGTPSYIPGDINNDRLVDRNDLTSYTNYTGLRLGDADFEGYVSNGDVNKNNLIDAYDISTVATRIDGGVKNSESTKVAGNISISTKQKTYAKDEIIEVLVTGKDLKDVNALSFAIPYNESSYKFVGIETLNTFKMENLTNDRLHSNREKVLYPTFVNLGNQETLKGSLNLFIIKFKAIKKGAFDLKALEGLLVDKNLTAVKF
ncbi:discoidin domain-containing protein [Gelidibacter salicanalis]|uniref:Discoidin domain-containing protein n=1 Tax=Gelidibacter salicanalis TaxID=291193 RepID=A0A934KQZ6_9FLAO|nr:discoidin domain-containing protein [Gelidibacter salicanalis]